MNLTADFSRIAVNLSAGGEESNSLNPNLKQTPYSNLNLNQVPPPNNPPSNAPKGPARTKKPVQAPPKDAFYNAVTKYNFTADGMGDGDLFDAAEEILEIVEGTPYARKRALISLRSYCKKNEDIGYDGGDIVDLMFPVMELAESIWGPYPQEGTPEWEAMNSQFNDH